MPFQRLTGLAGIVFVVLVGGFNILLGASGAPLNAADAADIAGYLANNNATITTISVIAPLVWVSLLVFGIGVFAKVRSTDVDRGEAWGALGLVGVLLVCAMFSIVVGTYVALSLGADSLAANSALTEMIWRFNRAMFTLNGTGLAVALLGFSMAGERARFISTGHARVGFVGAVLSLASATAVTPVVNGSAVGLLGLAGFLVWLGWVVAVSIRLLRDASPTATAAGANLA